MNLARKIHRAKTQAWRKSRIKRGLPPGLIATYNAAGEVFIEGVDGPIPDLMAEPLPDGGVKFVIYE